MIYDNLEILILGWYIDFDDLLWLSPFLNYFDDLQMIYSYLTYNSPYNVDHNEAMN